MSRIGKQIITITQGVAITQKEQELTVTGPKGAITLVLPEGVSVAVEGQTAQVSVAGTQTSVQGLFRTLVANAIVGVTTGWDKKLELVGVGYRAAGGGNEITLNVGYSHPVKIQAPALVSFTIAENTKIVVSGIDKKVVGEVAAKIRRVKPPEPYKGKGIRYVGEYIRRKAGKAVKAAGA